MKTPILLTMLLCLFAAAAGAQALITVDVAARLKVLNGREAGINLNYLMDGGYTNPATSTGAALKKMGIKLVRYPGGEKSDNYLWSAAPWTAAAPRMALLDTAKAWPTSDDRFVNKASAQKVCKPVVLDFDELMTLCNEAGAAPLIVVAYDAMYNSVVAAKPTKQQLITNAVEWVRYANVVKKFGIKYWMIGNESWHNPDYNGSTTVSQYAADLTDFARAMKAVDPTIKIIANGQSSWWPVLLQSPAVSLIDMLAISHYPVDNFAKGYETYRTGDISLTGEINDAVQAIDTYAPAADRARLKVLAAEYNSIDFEGGWSSENNLGHALVNFQMFGDMVEHPKVESACLWNTRWITNDTAAQHLYDALDKNGNLNAIGVAQQVWGSHLLNTMVGAASSDAQVVAYASFDTITRNLNLFLLNKDTAAKAVRLSIANYQRTYSASRSIFGGTSANDKSPTFSVAGSLPDSAALASLTLAPTSVTVLKIAPTTETIAFAAAVAPNPVGNALRLQTRSGTAQQAMVQVVDALGRVWASEKVSLPAGAAMVTLRSVQGLPRGVYWLQLVAGSQRKTIPFLKG